MSIEMMEPTAFMKRHQAESGLCLVDVRTPLEYAEVHAEMAQSLPLQQLDEASIARFKGMKEVFLICKSGARAKQAAEKLLQQGIGHPVVLTGGTDGWLAANLPVKRAAGVMSLERQVRIAAGALVAIFALLTILLHPAFVYGALFVGCGLVFAGVTNFCGMGLLIARMPWNKNLNQSCSR